MISATARRRLTDLDHLVTECRQIVGLAARDQVAIHV
jgi:hypothetical protein